MNGLPIPAGQFGESWSTAPATILRSVVAGLFSATSTLQIPNNPLLDQLGPSEVQDLWDQAILRGALPSFNQISPSPYSLRIVDLFCGCGGLTSGVLQAARASGLSTKILAAADSNPHILEVYGRNFAPEVKVQGNLWELVEFQVAGQREAARFVDNPRILDSTLMAAGGKVDILLGGPPCEGHSNFNNRSRRNDPRNLLYLVIPAVAMVLQPKVVIIENVPGIVHDKRGVVQTARRLFESAGYVVEEGVADALRLGVPQTRKRHLLIASKTKAVPLQATLEALNRSPRSVEWAVSDLLDREATSPFDAVAEYSPETRRRIQYLMDTDTYNLPNEIRPDSHKKGNTYPSVYGRLRWGEPAGTITTGFVTPGRGRFVHPLRARTLTAHEAARLQGFPDSYEFRSEDGSVPARKWLSQMIGDAVPPAMGYAAGLAAISILGSSH